MKPKKVAKNMVLVAKHHGTPLGAAAAALLAVRLLGVGKTLLVAAGAAAGFYLGAKKVKEDWSIIV